ncbi:hypothetical protein [Gordonia sp. N1V]|uniref:hypothetical protein n=1 Tax=Gordonia sp. N1V TaxID=3034163 RepID=UPI0023E1A44D|nr:hypothetical protein [Gordonia sp. N1V]MDF3280916.1 hypothetical protein [Gordonia sp. N1V]
MQITKALATIEGTDDTGSGTFDAILSAPTLDRDGDTFATSEWKTPLPDHITIDIDHGMKVASTVGSAQPFIDDDGNLRIKGSFASTDLGQQVRTLVNEGHIRTMSVAALESRTKSADGDDEVSRELLNGAFVAVPSNREAVILSSKALDVIEKATAAAQEDDADPAPGTPKHDDMVQAVHDASVALGADCVVPGDDAGDGASEGANKSWEPEVTVAHKAAGETVHQTIDFKTKAEYANWIRGAFSIAAREGLADVAVVKSKAISGSIDDMTQRISDAVRALAPGANEYAYVRTLFLDTATSGTVVYDLEDNTGCQTLSRPFSFDGTSATLGETATPVEMVTSVQPVNDTKSFEDRLDAVLKTPDADPGAGTRDESTPDAAADDSAASDSAPPAGRADDDPAEPDVTESADDDLAAKSLARARLLAIELQVNSTISTQEV